jgi:transglutaminase-like putative cysteine protease
MGGGVGDDVPSSGGRGAPVSRARVGDSLLALLCVAAVVAPIRPLFTPDSWIPGAVAMAVSVTVTGMLVRALTRRDVPVVLGQIVVGVLLAGWLFGRGHLWYGLPTWRTMLAFNNILVDARETITSYAPPAPSGRGILLAMALIVWITMLLVDFLAVTRGSPALAGIPLFAAFLIAASNSGSGMPVLYFVVAALLWLLLLSRSGTVALARWDATSRTALRRSPGPVGWRLAGTARGVAFSAVAIAALVAALLPHLPTRFLLDGLGRATDSTGATGTMTLNSTVNLARSLESQSETPVLTYTTTATTAEPLRVAVLDVYDNGEWQERDGTLAGVPRFDSLVPGPVDEESERETIEVTTNNLAAPQLALPYPPSDLTIETRWRTRGDGTVLVDQRIDSYRAEYLSRVPSEEDLQGSRAVPPGVGQQHLRVDPASAGVVDAVLSGIVSDDMSPIDKARAIQDHLRGPDYTYSLELAGPTVDGSGNLVQLDPLSHFLLTRQGYCTQFASAMVMMARAEGIPARFAIGFLPGEASPDDVRTVVAADAHAWPELYFDGLGWLRFEPTPATRTSSAPGYSDASWGDPEAESPTPTTTSTATAAPTRDLPQDVPIDDPQFQDGTTSQSGLRAFIDRYAWLILVLALGALGAATLPLSAWVERRRRRRAARDDAARVEVIWQDLLERLDDVGVATPPDASPRQVGAHIWDETFLTKESRTALSRVVTAVERARYARPTGVAEPERIAALEKDAHTVSANVVGSLQRSERIRAAWWPTAGVRAWSRLGRRLTARFLPGEPDAGDTSGSRDASTSDQSR